MNLHSTRKVRVYLVVYSQRYLEQSKYWLSVFVRHAFQTANYSLVVVDNAANSDEGAVYAGDNSSREFSGWDIALQKDASFLESDWIVIANDSFFRNYHRSYLYLFRNRVKRLSADAIVGWLDDARFDLAAGKSLATYIRTNLFVMSGKVASSLGPFSSEVAAGVRMSSKPDELIERNGLLARDYLDRLEEWLIADKPHKYYRHKWYRARGLTAVAKPELFQKARCIINEHQLSQRAVSTGITLVGINTVESSFMGKVGRMSQRLLCRVDEARWRYSVRRKQCLDRG